MLTPQQESTLTSGGDSFDHFHSADRVVTQRTVRDFHSILRERNVSGSYVLTDSDDVLLCTSTATIQFPLAKNGREFEVVLLGAGPVTCICASTDLVYGAASVVLDLPGTALHFKAISGGWILI